jgi:hypothetical protein
VSDDKDGTCNVGVLPSGLKVDSEKFMAVAMDGGEAATLEIEPNLADRLRAHRPWQRERGSDRGEDSWEKHVATLTIGVFRNPRLPAEAAWVCRIRKIEFLLSVDGRRLVYGPVADAFQTYTIATDREGAGRGNSFDWQKRLGTQLVHETRVLAQNILAGTASKHGDPAQATGPSSALDERIPKEPTANVARGVNPPTRSPRQVPTPGSIFDQDVRLDCPLK